MIENKELLRHLVTSKEDFYIKFNTVPEFEEFSKFFQTEFNPNWMIDNSIVSEKIKNINIFLFIAHSKESCGIVSVWESFHDENYILKNASKNIYKFTEDNGIVHLEHQTEQINNDVKLGAIMVDERILSTYESIIDQIKNNLNTYVHCENFEDAVILTNWAHKNNCKWADGSPYEFNTNWYEYKNNTCYNFSHGWYNDITFLKDVTPVYIFKFSEIEREIKKDLKGILFPFIDEKTNIIQRMIYLSEYLNGIISIDIENKLVFEIIDELNKLSKLVR